MTIMKNDDYDELMSNILLKIRFTYFAFNFISHLIAIFDKK